jgi:hypothetical protein
MMPHNESYFVTAYVIAAVVYGLYALSLRRRLRNTQRHRETAGEPRA